MPPLPIKGGAERGGIALLGGAVVKALPPLIAPPYPTRGGSDFRAIYTSGNGYCPPCPPKKVKKPNKCVKAVFYAVKHAIGEGEKKRGAGGAVAKFIQYFKVQ
jgi:hypothetical protein